jgi:acylphosphatase
MARVGKSIRVRGRVQGVFFRAWTADQARGLGVGGWIRNCPDGSVEAHAEGDEQAVATLIERMRDGPSGARVAQLVSEEAECDDTRDFEVRH